MPETKKNKLKSLNGNLFILSAPSGAGKTTLCKALLEKFPDIVYSVSYTTRPPRGNEKHGKDYFFIEKAAFENKLKQDYWAEWANVHGHFYGTSREILDNYLAMGRDILLDIDVQGTRQILEHYPHSVTIFVMPPSLEALRIRLESRATDTAEVIERRLRDAEKEIEQRHIYRHLIINDKLEEAVAILSGLVAGYRSRL
ncbi:MAG: guanylate kinase [Desulfobacterales bacterium]|nr:guanylate kinase [Desulfobacterales bacterium]